jgi:hypothetical protein
VAMLWFYSEFRKYAGREDLSIRKGSTKKINQPQFERRSKPLRITGESRSVEHHIG